jgi:hypothetical protein
MCLSVAKNRIIGLLYQIKRIKILEMYYLMLSLYRSNQVYGLTAIHISFAYVYGIFSLKRLRCSEYDNV